MNTDDIMEVLATIWGDTEGYVFVPNIYLARGKQRWTLPQIPFKWPEHRHRIAYSLDNPAADDCDRVFALNVYNQPRGFHEYTAAFRAIWVDLDGMDHTKTHVCPHPRDIEPRPTFAWETSPGHYQAVWILDRAVTGDEWAHLMTVVSEALHADYSVATNFDIAIPFARVPGTPNRKYRDNPVGKMVISDPWRTVTPYSLATMAGVGTGTGTGAEDM